MDYEFKVDGNVLSWSSSETLADYITHNTIVRYSLTVLQNERYWTPRCCCDSPPDNTFARALTISRDEPNSVSLSCLGLTSGYYRIIISSDTIRPPTRAIWCPGIVRDDFAAFVSVGYLDIYVQSNYTISDAIVEVDYFGHEFRLITSGVFNVSVFQYVGGIPTFFSNAPSDNQFLLRALALTQGMQTVAFDQIINSSLLGDVLTLQVDRAIWNFEIAYNDNIGTVSIGYGHWGFNTIRLQRETRLYVRPAGYDYYIFRLDTQNTTEPPIHLAPLGFMPGTNSLKTVRTTSISWDSSDNLLTINRAVGMRDIEAIQTTTPIEYYAVDIQRIEPRPPIGIRPPSSPIYNITFTFTGWTGLQSYHAYINYNYVARDFISSSWGNITISGAQFNLGYSTLKLQSQSTRYAIVDGIVNIARHTGIWTIYKAQSGALSVVASHNTTIPPTPSPI